MAYTSMPDVAELARLVSLEEIRAAAARVAAAAIHTPLQPIDPAILTAAGHQLPYRIYVKREDLQPIGSFKIRGAYNYMAQLSAAELARGVITYSSGNHAQGVAWSARALGAKAVIVMPSNVPMVKRDAVISMGAEVVIVGIASSERRIRAEELAAQHGYVIIPPYNDRRIIAGAATCGLEIAEDLPEIDCVLAPVGGGGLLSGSATAIRALRPGVRVFGVEPELAADAAASFAAKRIVELPGELTARTIADGLRTQSIGSLNLQHFMRYVEGIVTVSEDQILSAMRVLATATGVVPEPSGAVAFASALAVPPDLASARAVAVILSGGNIDPELRKKILPS